MRRPDPEGAGPLWLGLLCTAIAFLLAVLWLGG